MVWWRVGITGLILLLWPGVRRVLPKLSKKVIRQFIWIGILVGLHWVCFFASVKYANASTALITMSLTALFTALIEPFILHTKLEKLGITLSILVVPAMILITQGLDGNMQLGFWLGIVAAFLLAYFTVLNRKYITGADPVTITFIEMTAAWLFITLFLPLAFYIWPHEPFFPGSTDIILLLILSIGCTVLPYILHLEALKNISALTTNLAINLEPVYGMILAAVILKEHEELGVNFYVGASILLVIIFAYPILKNHLISERAT